MTDIPGVSSGGQNINKQGGDALSVSGAGALSYGIGVQDGSYGEGGQGSASAGYVVGSSASAFADGAGAQGGAGGVDQTTIGDINISA